MPKKYIAIITAVLVLGTAVYTKLVFFPNIYTKEIADTPVTLEVNDVQSNQEEQPVEQIDYIAQALSLSQGKTDILNAKLLNRDLPSHWKGKELRFKYTYLGEYTENTQDDVNNLLLGEYKWQKQLDANGNIVLGGPMFIKDGIYQLHIHNGLSLGNRYYLFGDLLDWLYSQGKLENTQIQLGDLKLQAIWTKDTEILKDNTTPAGADLIMSTCLERNGDRRLIVGWIVIH